MDKIKAYLKEIGKRGGLKRVEKTTPEQRRKWGKMGGRPSKKLSTFKGIA